MVSVQSTESNRWLATEPTTGYVRCGLKTIILATVSVDLIDYENLYFLVCMVRSCADCTYTNFDLLAFKNKLIS